jgi:ribose 5-phosphate isomerase A
MAERFIVVADESKLVDPLSGHVPVEVVEFGVDVVTRRLEAMGASRVERRPQPSDNGNPIVDAWFAPIADPPAFALTLSEIPGIVEHGIFPGAMVERVVVGRADGVRELTR